MSQQRLPVSVGVVGAGFMGSLHARAVAALPYARVAGVVDVDAGRGQELARRVGGRFYPTLDQMLDDTALDAVIVATPEDQHREPVVRVAGRGLPVMVEKPLSTTAEDGEAMIDACRAAAVPLMVGFILRFDPAYARLKQFIQAGRLGQLVSVYARRNAPVQEAERLGGRTNPIDYLAVHDIDQVLWYHQVPVRRILATSAAGPVGRRLGVPDMTWIWMEFEDGATAVIESGWTLPPRWAGWREPGEWASFGDVRMDLVGTEGMTSLDFRNMNVLGVDAEGWKYPDTRHWPVMHGLPSGALKEEVEHFLRCVMDGSAPVVDGVQAQRVTKVVAAAHLSLREGRHVEVSI